MLPGKKKKKKLGAIIEKNAICGGEQMERANLTQGREMVYSRQEGEEIFVKRKRGGGIRFTPEEKSWNRRETGGERRGKITIHSMLWLDYQSEDMKIRKLRLEPRREAKEV